MGLYSERVATGFAEPGFRGRVVYFAGVGIDEDGFGSCAFYFMDQAGDKFWGGAVDANSGNLRILR